MGQRPHLGGQNRFYQVRQIQTKATCLDSKLSTVYESEGYFSTYPAVFTWVSSKVSHIVGKKNWPWALHFECHFRSSIACWALLFFTLLYIPTLIRSLATEWPDKIVTETYVHVANVMLYCMYKYIALSICIQYSRRKIKNSLQPPKLLSTFLQSSTSPLYSGTSFSCFSLLMNYL